MLQRTKVRVVIHRKRGQFSEARIIIAQCVIRIENLNIATLFKDGQKTVLGGLGGIVQHGHSNHSSNAGGGHFLGLDFRTVERNDVAFRPMISVGQSHAWAP